MKIGPVGDYGLKFGQELVPETRKEIELLLKVCCENNYYFAFVPLDKPVVLKSAIGNREFEAKWFVLVDKSDSMDIVEKVECYEAD